LEDFPGEICFDVPLFASSFAALRLCEKQLADDLIGPAKGLGASLWLMVDGECVPS